ncbi:peptidase M14 [Shewanella sp. NFH-SH190041]|uniref:M14 family zinc carboxypeptidase n=1 Tax=Shewanella sp. NFH-SH190041 TaxID=2950245 RepID=UPI0021C376CA|nr:M14 family zinc carboxypeptidase [Shewanella sp. NFH-SH190041]BDM62856.1 peptidase M14 [Shewanella sp. NFH-SH190041]
MLMFSLLKWRLFLPLLTLCYLLPAKAQDWYPPTALTQQVIPTPADFLGYPLGFWHLRHGQINGYLQQLANLSPRVTLEQTGLSHQARRQLTAVITSEVNQQRLPDILAERAKIKQGKSITGPLIIWLAYSIHGDEASGAHAATALSYYLSASNEPWVKSLLQQAVILITPTQNPDGLDRFANWVNNHRGTVPSADPASREHLQGWPRGRFNHYLADLNRDWLFLIHPESRGRVALFHRWQPHYVGDFHEMGRHSSYFFQPGVPSRTHPLTPPHNQQLTDKLANFHREALDNRHQPYFSRQAFDDFFYGKGSTYPDINGAIGVLFEQASARGQQQESRHGLVTLAEGINNQFATSLSSLRGAIALKDELIAYQQQFFRHKQAEAGRRINGFLLSAPHDPARRDSFAQLLRQHQIQFYYLNQPREEAGYQFTPTDSLFIPTNQPQQALLQAMFDKRQTFTDATFYDISSFDLQAAYGLQKTPQLRLKTSQLSQTPLSSNKPEVSSRAATEVDSDQALPVVYLFDWRNSHAPVLLEQLLQVGLTVNFTTQPLSLRGETQSTNDPSSQHWPAGSLIVALKQSGMSLFQAQQQILQLAQQHQLIATPGFSFASLTGLDLGSRDIVPVRPVTPLLLAGKGIHSSSAGQLWHFLDKQLGIATPLLEPSRLNNLDLRRYSHLLLADGHYPALTDKAADNIRRFLHRGGTVIAQQRALRWLSRHNLLQQPLISQSTFQALFATDNLTFVDQATLAAKRAIGGVILNLDTDPSHPLNFGLTAPIPTVMKNRQIGFTPAKQPFITSANYADPLVSSGYLADEYQQQLTGSPAMLVERHGKGQIVALADNLLFRNTWRGSEKIIANALYFIPTAMR